MICAPTIPQSDPLYHTHTQYHTVTSRVAERVTTGLLAKISQDERLHLTDQEGAPDESPTSTRNGANLVGWARFKVSEGGNKAETRGRNHD